MSVSGERELEEFLADALSGKADAAAAPQDEVPEEVASPPPGSEAEEVVRDEAPGEEPPEDDTPVPPLSPEEPKPAEEVAEEELPEEPAEEEDEHVSWATKRFGDDPAKWARAAYEREQHIGRLQAEKGQAEEAAQQAIAYAREIEANAQASNQMGMPLSAQEEAWVDEAMANPAGYAYAAARGGHAQLYNAVIERIAEENPGFAAQIGTQVQMALQEERARFEAEQRQREEAAPQDFASDMAASFERLGIDVQRYGEAMWAKIEELGDYHRYTQAILGGNAMQRDLAIQAVYDLVRAGQTQTRRVPNEREEQIRREGELRREAAGVVTGSPHVEQPKADPFFAGMEEEWRRRGQWPYEPE